jgi:hypothetical protein
VLTFDSIDTFYQILKLVPLNYNIDYQGLAVASAIYTDYSLLKDIFDMAPRGYNWNIEPIVEKLILDRKRIPDESRDLCLIMEFLISVNPNLDYIRLLDLAVKKNDTEIAELFEAYHERRNQSP